METTTTTTHQLTIVGPNGLNGFHVHAAGCADLAKPRYRAHKRGGEFHTCSFASAQEVVTDMYSDIMAENDETEADWQNYVGEFKFFPCCKDLPNEV